MRKGLESLGAQVHWERCRGFAQSRRADANVPPRFTRAPRRWPLILQRSISPPTPLHRDARTPAAITSHRDHFLFSSAARARSSSLDAASGRCSACTGPCVQSAWACLLETRQALPHRRLKVLRAGFGLVGGLLDGAARVLCGLRAPWRARCRSALRASSKRRASSPRTSCTVASLGIVRHGRRSRSTATLR